MKWQKVNSYHYCSDKGYKVTAFIIEGETLFRAFKPDVQGELTQAIGGTYTNSKLAKHACEKINQSN